MRGGRQTQVGTLAARARVPVHWHDHNVHAYLVEGICCG